MTQHQITSEKDLRAIMGEPVHELVLVKSSERLTEPMKKYIELSPFVCLATQGEDGSGDVSPRGDAPGFVYILNERTLVIPDRPGNKRLDSIINIINLSIRYRYDLRVSLSNDNDTLPLVWSDCRHRSESSINFRHFCMIS